MYEVVYVCIILFLVDRKFKTSAFSLELLSVFEGSLYFRAFWRGGHCFIRKQKGQK